MKPFLARDLLFVYQIALSKFFKIKKYVSLL